MGRQLITNLPRIKHVYNSYSNSSSTLNGFALQYTVPTGKTAKINFNYFSTLRSNNSQMTEIAFTLFATKKTSNPKHHSPIALGRYKKDGSQGSGAMVQFKPWYLYSEAAGNATVSVGSYNKARIGVSSHYVESMFSGTNNDLSSGSGNTVKGHFPDTSIYDPWTGSYGDAAPCDAIKDYLCPSGTQIYLSYYSEHNTSPGTNGNQVDIMFEVEEAEQYA